MDSYVEHMEAAVFLNQLMTFFAGHTTKSTRQHEVLVSFVLSQGDSHRPVCLPYICIHRGANTRKAAARDYEVPRWQRTGRNGSCRVQPLWTKVALHTWSNRDDDRAKKVNAISQSCGSSTLVKRHNLKAALTLMNMHISHQGTGYVEEREIRSI